jgi:UTP-glucose-1-phosphate uridylyltransferase
MVKTTLLWDLKVNNSNLQYITKEIWNKSRNFTIRQKHTKGNGHLILY